ncbi:MAG TPA: nucleotide sugar dehydrogenase [Nocardioides sp.]|nr:nucleotide sugar dehydrogenase [Nocardioides sp.]
MSTLVVVGLGYVGLPLAQLATRRGLQTVGLDADPAVVERLNDGRSHVDDISDAEVAAMVAGGFRATTDAGVVAEAGTVVVCVPTPLSSGGGPDLSMVSSAMREIGARLTRDTLVVLESTTYPGTTEELVRPLLEEASGLGAGTDFFLAFSPERVDPGNKHFTVENTPKVVGGLTAACSDRAVKFYGGLVDTVVVARGTREAEMAKLLENTYRHVNIALVNEMAQFSHDLGIDFWDVIRLAETKPFGFQAFRPGPGVGGHCIPIDPNYLSHRVQQQLGYPFRFVELAEEINNTMPAYVASRVQLLLNEQCRSVRGSTILLLGVTYKADIADQRETPAKPLAERLSALGARVQYFDPHVPEWQVEGVERVADPAAAAGAADLTILVQPHSAFDIPALVDAAGTFLDLRGVAEGEGVHRL